jgi:hypothetical protein
VRTLASALEPIVQAAHASPLSPTHVRGLVLHIAHALHTARKDYIGSPALNRGRCCQYSLQSPTTTPVDLHARNLDREACLECKPAAGAGCFPIGIRLREHDIIDRAGIDRSFPDDVADDSGAQPLDRDAIKKLSQRQSIS